MKQKHTQAKKARRASAFHETGTFGTPSRLRILKRKSLQPKTPKTFGQQVKYIQRVFLKKDRFGAPVYRNVPHAVEQSPAPQA